MTKDTDMKDWKNAFILDFLHLVEKYSTLPRDNHGLYKFLLQMVFTAMVDFRKEQVK